jgi:hypothetical protein
VESPSPSLLKSRNSSLPKVTLMNPSVAPFAVRIDVQSGLAIAVVAVVE